MISYDLTWFPMFFYDFQTNSKDFVHLSMICLYDFIWFYMISFAFLWFKHNIQGFHMISYDFLLFLMSYYVFLWFQHNFTLFSMIFYDCSLIPKFLYDFNNSNDFCWFFIICLWFFMIFYDFLCCSMISTQRPKISYGFRWFSLIYCDFLWFLTPF